MSKKTMKQFIKDGKPDSAIFAISMEAAFAWAMVTSDGTICTRSNSDMELSRGENSAAYVMKLKAELATFLKLTEEIDGIILRLPMLKGSKQDRLLQKLIGICVVKAFFGTHDIPVLCVEACEISRHVVKEAQAISGGDYSTAAGREEVFALEALLAKIAPLEEESVDEDDHGLDVEISIRKVGAA